MFAVGRVTVTAIFLGLFWRTTGRWEQATWLVRNWPRIEDFVASNPSGTIGLIQQHGPTRCCHRLLKGVEGAGFVGLSRRRHRQQTAEVDEVLLCRGALFQGRVLPLGLKLEHVHSLRPLPP